jgi:hypothetical protein
LRWLETRGNVVEKNLFREEVLSHEHHQFRATEVKLESAELDLQYLAEVLASVCYIQY